MLPDKMFKTNETYKKSIAEDILKGNGKLPSHKNLQFKFRRKYEKSFYSVIETLKTQFAIVCHLGERNGKTNAIWKSYGKINKDIDIQVIYHDKKYYIYSMKNGIFLSSLMFNIEVKKDEIIVCFDSKEEAEIYLSEFVIPNIVFNKLSKITK